MIIGSSPSGRGSSCSSVADRVGCFTVTMSKYLYPQVYYGSYPIPLHCSLLPSINDCIPIDIVLEQRCAKFIWSCLNSYNTINKTTALSAISSGNCSTFFLRRRFISMKLIYKIIHNYNTKHTIYKRQEIKTKKKRLEILKEGKKEIGVSTMSFIQSIDIIRLRCSVYIILCNRLDE